MYDWIWQDTPHTEGDIQGATEGDNEKEVSYYTKHFVYYKWPNLTKREHLLKFQLQ